MKLITKSFLFIILFCSFLSIYSQSNKEVNLKEEKSIRAAIEDKYIKGLETREFSLIEEVCTLDAELLSVNVRGKLNITTLTKWSKRFDPNHPPFSNLESCIVKIDRKGKAAQVKVMFVIDHTREIVDFLNMLKIDGKWKIVNIIDS